MRTPLGSVLYFVLASLLGAIGQYLYKSGADRLMAMTVSRFFNARIIGGMACYVAVMILFVAAFKRGGSPTVLYPVYATTFIWAAIIGMLAYDIPIKPINIAGMVLLIAGVYLMGVQ